MKHTSLAPNFIYQDQSMREALERLNSLEHSLTLFILNEQDQLVGTMTDGDVRRGFLDNLTMMDPIKAFMKTNFQYLKSNQFTIQDVESIKDLSVSLLPILDDQLRVIRVVDFSQKRHLLPLHVVIMAGGKGTRLKPLTDTVPKPLLKIGNKPIIEHNIDRLASFGVYNFHISIKYLGDQLVEYFGDGSKKNLSIRYISEDEPMGTIGAVGLIPDEEFQFEDILLMNSDLLTDIDYAGFYKAFKESDADLAIATTPYEVKVPYAVMETEKAKVISFKEKPTYVYYSNAGIYLLKSSCLKYLPKGKHFNSTDLIERLIEEKKNVIQFPIHGYWLDIGKPQDYHKALEDIKHINL